MVTWIIERLLTGLERRLGANVDHLRLVAANSRSAFFKVLGFVPLAAHRGRTDRELLFAVRFAATRHEDCGGCAQMVIQQALREGVPLQTQRAVIDDDLGNLDQRIRLALEFTRAVLHNTDEQSRLRAALRAELGERSLVDLSLAMASARVFPTLKRSLGFSTHCQRLSLPFPHESGASSS